MFFRIIILLALGAVSLLAAENKLKWTALPDLPGGLGVAGPFAGVHNDALIVAGGANACILHYVENNQPLADGDLILIDAGAEWSYYASDV